MADVAALRSGGGPLAIIAGGGAVPMIVASAAERAGRPVLILGIEGAADTAIASYPHRWIGWGQLGRLLRSLRDHKTRELVLVGRIDVRPDYRRLRLDLGTLRALPTILRILFSGGDNAVLTGTVKFFEDKGYRVVGAHEVAHELVADAGTLTRAQPSAADLRDAELAFTAARAIGELDIGQAAAAVAGRVVALEGAEGTDGMLERVGQLRAAGRIAWDGKAGVLAKCAKPQQDLRVDMPTIGPTTVRSIVAAGLAGIVIEAGRVMLAEREALLRLADEAGIFILARGGLEPGGS